MKFSKETKIIVTSILSVLIILVVISIIKRLNKDLSIRNELTIEQVKKASEKGTNLSWKDFKQYESRLIGSGLYILYYEIEGDYHLIIGGTSIDREPMYIRLVLDSNTDKYIDIRTENIEDFINRTNKDYVFENEI